MIEEFKASGSSNYSTCYTQSISSQLAINLHDESQSTTVAITQYNIYSFQKHYKAQQKATKKAQLEKRRQSSEMTQMDFLGHPVAKTLLPMQGTQENRSHMPQLRPHAAK